jgi:hypothetical protein
MLFLFCTTHWMQRHPTSHLENKRFSRFTKKGFQSRSATASLLIKFMEKKESTPAGWQAAGVEAFAGHHTCQGTQPIWYGQNLCLKLIVYCSMYCLL